MFRNIEKKIKLFLLSSPPLGEKKKKKKKKINNLTIFKKIKTLPH
jgi:hypothetical protein